MLKWNIAKSRKLRSREGNCSSEKIKEDLSRGLLCKSANWLLPCDLRIVQWFCPADCPFTLTRDGQGEGENPALDELGRKSWGSRNARPKHRAEGLLWLVIARATTNVGLHFTCFKLFLCRLEHLWYSRYNYCGDSRPLGFGLQLHLKRTAIQRSRS